MTTEVKDGPWLLIKRGLYWRPDAQGYTGLKSEAGRYSDAHARSYDGTCDAHDLTTTRMLAVEAPDIAPGCSDEAKARYWESRATAAEGRVAMLEEEREEQQRRIDRLEGALEPFVRYAQLAQGAPDGESVISIVATEGIVRITYADFRRARLAKGGQ